MERMKAASVAAALVLCTIATAGVRDRQWEKVREAIERGRPRTAVEALEPIARATLAEGAHAEATRAILQRIALEGASEGNRPEEKIARLEAEIGKVPEPMRPVMDAILARWMWQYFRQNRWRIVSRSPSASAAGDDLTSWDLPRIYREIDARFARALSAEALLKRTPIAEWDALLERGTAPDSCRPTLYDFVAAEALEFYTSGEQAGARPEDAFEVAADGPIFSPADEFIRWNVTTADSTSPAFRAIRLYQELLRFHANDTDPSARIDADLARLRFGRNHATGPEKSARCMAALEQLADRARGHELSARALAQHAGMLHELGDLPAAWTVARRGAEGFPESVGGRECYNLIQAIEAKDLSIATERVWNSPPPAIEVRYRNLSRIHFRVVPLDFEAWAATHHESPERLGATRLAELLALEPVLRWSAELPATPDFRERRERLPTPERLAPGAYYLLASDTGTFTTTDHPVQATVFWVSTLALVLRNDGDGVEGFVLDASTGAPVVGAQVRTWFGVPSGPMAGDARIVSDRDGRFRISSPGRINVVLASHSGQRLASRDGMWAESQVDPEPHESSLLFTDRALYRPGQTIRYKGLCIRSDRARDRYEVLPARTMAVVFRDDNGREIARQEHRTNDHGSFSGSFTVPRDRLLGHMSLIVDSGPAGSVRISAEEYKRPRFAVALESPPAEVRLAEEVSVPGRATAYTGAAVDGAGVRWRVVRVVRYPVWRQWRFGMDRYAAEQEIAHGSTTTGADGTFQVPFVARPDPAVDASGEPAFVFSVRADVTDRAGETRSAERTVVVGYTALAATVSAGAWQEVAKPVELVVRTASLDGTPMASAGEIIIDRLRQPARVERGALIEEYSRAWRHRSPPAVALPDSSFGPDPATWPADQTVLRRTVRMDTTGVDTLAVKLPAGAYRARLETRDRFGKRVTAELPLTVLDPKSDRCPIRMPDLLSAPSWSVEPGEEFVAVWGSGYPEARAYVEVEHRGKALQAFWSAPGRNQLVIRQRVDEGMRGGFMVRVTMVHENRAFLHERRVEVPWSNKQLVLRWERFVSKLEPGARETWTAVIRGPGAKPAVAEMVATLYDASLDAFRPNGWPAGFDAFRQEYRNRGARFENTIAALQMVAGRWPLDSRPVTHTYRAFPAQVLWDWARHGGRLWLGLESRSMGIEVRSEKRIDTKSSTTRQSISGEQLRALPVDDLRAAIGTKGGVVSQGGELFFRGGRSGEYGYQFDGVSVAPGAAGAGTQARDLGRVAPRRNLEETAFFFPHLASDARGEVRMSFTMPEALTQWRFLGFAHDHELRAGLLEGRAVTVRELMVQPNPPRFLREGDTLEFTVRVTNLSARRQTGRVRLTLNDAVTGASADEAVSNRAPDQPFDVPARESRVHAWRLATPDGAGMLTYKAVASTDRQSDGEEGYLPVLSRRILVTESLPLPIRGAQARAFDFARLRLSDASPTLRHQSLTLQMVAQPSWYAVMALPYLMESSNQCVERTFNRLYANALARHVATSDPKIARVFDQWRATPALDSPLERDPELKAVGLEETPWLRQAKAESQARRDVGILFDRNRIDDETRVLEGRLAEQQLPHGAWPWFPGGRGDDYMTLYITTGFGRLRHLGANVGTGTALRAVDYLDGWVEASYRAASTRRGPDRLSPSIVLYLYGRSFFLEDRTPSPATRTAIDYWLAQGRRYWLTLPGRQSQAQLALALARFGDRRTAGDIMRSLHERASRSEELGMFWRDDERSWWWYRAPIETQAVLIEAFDEVARDSVAVEDCKVWLLKQKQTQDWKTSKATADAVYALLLRGRDLLGSDTRVEVSLGGQDVRPDAVQAGTGYFERRFVGREITPQFAAVSVRRTGPGVSWGSLHWQYLEDINAVTAYTGTPLTLRKTLHTRQPSARGPVLEPVNGTARVGDELVVRIELRVDRDMEYVHLKDQRGSGVEPTQVLSGYRYQDGLRYYASTRDMASHFYIDYLPKGVYVFEYTARVQHRGRYATGMAEIQCMYAPEFNSHSASLELDVR